MFRQTIPAALGAVLAGAVTIGPAVAECDGPNLAVTELTIQEIAQQGPDQYEFEIVCKVSNIGNQDFTSQKRGQGIYLMKLTGNEEDELRLRYRRFSEMMTGEVLQVSSFLRGWDVTETPPPQIACWVMCEPGNYLDNDPDNNDCDTTNNRMLLQGDGINALLKQDVLDAPPIPAEVIENARPDDQ